MSRRGANWYQREPHAYLGGVRGMTAKLHAVYSVVLDLIYDGGGECPNDPKWISGWFSDLGPASVRKAISDLCEIGKLAADDGVLTNKRATIEAKTDRETREKRRESGGKGGRISGERRAKRNTETNENSDIGEASASTKNEAEKSRVEKKSSVSKDTGDPPLSEVIFGQGLRFLQKSGVAEKKARSMLGKWRKLHGDERLLSALGKAQREGALDPIAFCEGVFRHANGGAPPRERMASDGIMAELRREREEDAKATAGGGR